MWLLALDLCPKLCGIGVETVYIPYHDPYAVRSHLSVVTLLPSACPPVSLLGSVGVTSLVCFWVNDIVSSVVFTFRGTFIDTVWRGFRLLVTVFTYSLLLGVLGSCSGGSCTTDITGVMESSIGVKVSAISVPSVFPVTMSSRLDSPAPFILTSRVWFSSSSPSSFLCL